MSLTLPSVASHHPHVTPGLAEQLLSLRRRWRIILASTVLVPGLALVGVLRTPLTYTATGIVLYDPGSATVPGDNNTVPQDASDEDAVVASQSEVIASLP